MMIKLFLTLTILFITLAFVPNTSTQDSPQKQLPEGAKIRIDMISKDGQGRVRDIAYSPDGTRLAVASTIGIRLYDAQIGNELNLLTDNASDATSVAFSPDGKTIAGGILDGTIYLWDVDAGTRLHKIMAHAAWVSSIAFSPDGKTIASGGDGFDSTIRLWDVNTGARLRTIAGTGETLSVVFSPDGKTIASGGLDKPSDCGMPTQEHASTHSQGICFGSIA